MAQDDAPHTHPTADLRARLASYRTLVQTELAGALHGGTEVQRFYQMMAYHFGWVDRHFTPLHTQSGKQLRSSLCLLLTESLGGAVANALPFAAGIEMLHNFSLVHDDIQDRSLTRRGRPTLWSLWGAPQAINAGDALFALAHRLWLSSSLAESDPMAFAAIARSLEQAVLTLCEGQYQDMNGEGNLDISSEQYLAMIANKTASLIGESAWVGARVATGKHAACEAARRFGRSLGLAFQIRDDLLGIWGDEDETGKSASSDIATRKMTLPVILALEAPDQALVAALRRMYGHAPDEGEEDYATVRTILERAGAQEHALDAERQHWRLAMHALDELPLTPDWHDRLHLFARSFVERSA